jgi:hypothetical protein
MTKLTKKLSILTASAVVAVAIITFSGNVFGQAVMVGQEKKAEHEKASCSATTKCGSGSSVSCIGYTSCTAGSNYVKCDGVTANCA